MEKNDFLPPINVSSRSRYILLVFVAIGLFIAFFISAFINDPTMLYFCTIVILINIIALLFKSPMLSSLSLSFLPVYVALMIDIFFYQSLGIIIHIVNFTLCCIIAVRDWKSMHYAVVFAGGLLNVALILTFSFFIKTEFTDTHHFKWNGDILNIYTMLIYIGIVGILSYAVYYTNKSTSVNKNAILQYNVTDFSNASDSNVVYIDISGSKLRDFPEISRYTNLKFVDASNNAIAFIPPTICNMPPDFRMNISRNPLSELPACVKCDVFRTNCKIIKL